MSFHQNSIIFYDMTQSYVGEMDYNLTNICGQNLKHNLRLSWVFTFTQLTSPEINPPIQYKVRN